MKLPSCFQLRNELTEVSAPQLVAVDILDHRAERVDDGPGQVGDLKLRPRGVGRVAATRVASPIAAPTRIGAGASRVLNLPAGVIAFIAVEFPRPVETRPRGNFRRFGLGHWAGSGNICLWRDGKRSRRRLRHQTVRTDRQDKQEPAKSGMCGVSFQQIFLDFRVPGRALFSF